MIQPSFAESTATGFPTKSGRKSRSHDTKKLLQSINPIMYSQYTKPRAQQAHGVKRIYTYTNTYTHSPPREHCILSVMKQIKKRVSLAKRIHWYPVTTLGWITTFVYTGLLVYVVFETNRELYSVNQAFFRGSILISGMIILILLWARFTGERPFLKK